MLDRRALFALPTALALAQPAAAQRFPDRPVRVVVSFAAGGNSDTIIRILAPKLQDALGQAIVVENRPGAGGAIAAGVVAQAPADGHTLLFDSFGFLVVPFLVKNLPYDHATAFAPVGQAVQLPYVLAVKRGFPARTPSEFVAYARANPGVPYGSPGTGSVGHLAGALLASRAGIKLEHVPYRGGADAVPDLAAGTVDAAMVTASSVRPVIEDGRAIGIALTSGARRGSLAALPTLAESGFPGFDLTSWNALFAPAATPPAVIAALEAALRAAVADPGTQQRLAVGGNDAAFEGAAEFSARISRERETVARIVAETGIRAE